MHAPAVARGACALILALGTVACGGAARAVTPSPVIARVAARSISEEQFTTRLRSTTVSLAQGGAPTADPAQTTDIRESVLRSLIVDTVIAEEAAALGLEASASAVQAEVNREAQSAGGLSALQQELAGAGGSVAQLQDEIRAGLNEQSLEDHFAAQRAAEVEHLLAGGAGFASLAARWSDDTGTSARGGDLGALTAADLTTYDPHFATAVRTLQVGMYTTTPVHDAGGYDIVMLYAVSRTSWSVRHVLVSAPTPYTVTERPTWFGEALFAQIAQLCEAGQIHVYLSNAGGDPCTASTPSPSAAATPTPRASR